jgi:hypothetical protein
MESGIQVKLRVENNNFFAVLKYQNRSIKTKVFYACNVYKNRFAGGFANKNALDWNYSPIICATGQKPRFLVMISTTIFIIPESVTPKWMQGVRA